ncbi:MAG: hypothetical protein WKF36_11735 [Candidatus Nitrosocosmicus sp.]
MKGNRHKETRSKNGTSIRSSNICYQHHNIKLKRKRQVDKAFFNNAKECPVNGKLLWVLDSPR